MSQSIFSQSLDEYQWKNRLVLVFTEEAENTLLQKQVKLFKQKQEEFKERKLKLIHIIPGKQLELFPAQTAWQDSELFQQKKKDSDFEIVLIGLDGGAKFRETKIVQPKEIFDLIDSMPMRQPEMRRKNN
ncbi:DUF4174 domain-containing protein [Gramella sp. GC03-9]|uniref:DUF4174 domain-containing protein n=1 Tax=Christiangramia oceanisediminis TaxID=2920386 RepID=A0A9X2I924_9FLAO|nr:DUF4174 domain-containing protein [Gramella oceanisediminis]MCP9199477.1 DUF4174 domain-containing protein [Gramella oceanisediminis]